MRRPHRVWTAVLVLSLLVSGCARDTKKPAAAPEPPPTDLRVIFHGDVFWDTLIDEFQKAEPSIRILKVSPWFEKKGMDEPPLAKAGNTDLDVTEYLANPEVQVDLYPTFTSATLVNEQKLLPLDPFLQRDQVDLKGYGSLIDSLRSDGKLYDLPVYTFPLMVYYSPKRFDEAKLPHPAAGWTWDQFRHAAAGLTGGSGESRTWGFADLAFPQMALTMVRQRGDQATQPESAREVVTFWGTLSQTDKATVPAEYTKDGKIDGNILMARAYGGDKVGMTFTHVSNETHQRVAKIGASLAMVPPPVFPDTPRVTVPVDLMTYGIDAKTKNPEAAWKFLRFITSPEAAVIMAKTGALPVHRTEAVKKAWLEQRPTPPPGSEALFTSDFATLYRREGSTSLQQKIFGALALAVVQVSTAEEKRRLPPDQAYAAFLQRREAILAEVKK